MTVLVAAYFLFISNLSFIDCIIMASEMLQFQDVYVLLHKGTSV